MATTKNNNDMNISSDAPFTAPEMTVGSIEPTLNATTKFLDEAGAVLGTPAMPIKLHKDLYDTNTDTFV